MIASQCDPLLFSILKAKYFPRTSFWRAPSHGPRSVFWGFILKTKHLLHENCSFKIHKGNCNIWSEQWCEAWDLMHGHLTLPVTVRPLPSNVQDLMERSTSTWNVPLINRVFSGQAARRILQVPIVVIVSSRCNDPEINEAFFIEKSTYCQISRRK